MVDQHSLARGECVEVISIATTISPAGETQTLRERKFLARYYNMTATSSNHADSVPKSEWRRDHINKGSTNTTEQCEAF